MSFDRANGIRREDFVIKAGHEETEHSVLARQGEMRARTY